MALLDFLKDTIGIDPGSHHLRIIKKGELIFNEPSQITLDKETDIVSGLGNNIKATAQDQIVRPVNCTIADFYGFESLLRGAMKKALNQKSILTKSYIMYYAIPSSSTDTEKRAYRDSGEHAGAIEVHLIHQNCCAATGMSLLMEQKHFILIDIGSSKIEMTVFANSRPISIGAIKMGTAKVLRLLRNFLRRNYKINASESEIESVLMELDATVEEIKIQHTGVQTRLLQDLLNSLFILVNDEFVETIERVSSHPDIEKVIAAGVYFTGGGSTIKFLRDQIKLDSRIRRTTSQDPILDNINGLKKIMMDREKYKRYIMV